MSPLSIPADDTDVDQQFVPFDPASREDEDDLHPQHYAQAVTWATDWTTETLVLQLERGTIDLDPGFQRRDAWTIRRKSKFIESLILGLPIPQIVLAERKDRKGSFLVIDGKQRLLTLQQFCAGRPDGSPGFILDSLTILTNANGATYADIQTKPSLSDMLSALNSQTIRTIVIKNWPNDDFLYTVFLRLNSNSVPLSPQELRKALHPGRFVTYVDSRSSASQPLMQALGLNAPDFRMRDVEIVVRYYAFKYYIQLYKGNLKQFLDDACEKLNKAWVAQEAQIEADFVLMEEALELTRRIFGPTKAFRKYTDDGYETRLNRAVFDIFLFYFSQPQYARKARSKASNIKKAFETLCTKDPEFFAALTTSTKITEVVSHRFNAWGRRLSKILRIPFHSPL